VAIFQHSLPFLQSNSFQTHQVGAIHRRAIGSLAHHNGTSAYSPSLTCTSPDDRISSSSTVLTRVLLSRNFPIRTQSSNQKESAAKYTCPHPTDLQTRLTSSFQVPFISPRHIHSNARFNCCVTRETQQTHCYATERRGHVTKET
jgi:hypothetical protein